MKTGSAWVMALGLMAAAGLHAGTLKVDPQTSWVKVDAKATGHSFTGNLEKFEAAVTGDDATLQPQSAVLRWDFSDLKTGDGKRDSEMLKWLEHGKSPKGEFRMNKTWRDKSGNSHAQGTLKIHNVVKNVTFPVTAKRDGKRVVIDGNVWLDYQDFSLPVVRAMVVMTVDPKLNVKFHLEGESK
jgi:polyisoprenoid-binding protein YceI